MLAVSMNDVMTWVFSLVQMTSTVAYTVSRRYGFYEEVLCSSGKRHCSWRENIKSIFITRISLGNTFQRKFCKCPTSLKCPTSMKSPTMSYISLKCPTSLSNVLQCPTSLSNVLHLSVLVIKYLPRLIIKCSRNYLFFNNQIEQILNPSKTWCEQEILRLQQLWWVFKKKQNKTI